MRVDRALDKLRGKLVRRGITTTALSLSATLSAHAVQAAPAGLAATVSAAAALAGKALATTAATATATKVIAMTTLQKTLVTATIAAAVGTGIYEARQASALRTRVQTLQQEQAPLTEQTLQLTRERDEATRQLATLGDEIERLNGNTSELLRLRGETGVLRQQTNRLRRLVHALSAALSTTNTVQASPEQRSFPRDSWTFAGFATPEATLQSYLWAKSRGDVKTAFATVTPKFKQEIITEGVRKLI
jgi:hypothetical protein